VTFFFENRAVYEIMWKKYCRAGQSEMTIWYTRIACAVSKATSAHSQYVILIAFSLQEWLHERASMLRSCVHCMSCFFASSSFLLLCPDVKVALPQNTYAFEKKVSSPMSQAFPPHIRHVRRFTAPCCRVLFIL